MKRRQFLISMARAGVVGTVFHTTRNLLASERPRVMTGIVQAEGQPLGGVAVSDGCRIVRTGRDGRYELPLGQDSGRFLFITTPSGYWTDAFYAPLAGAVDSGKADFTLRKMAQPSRFDFVFITDIHIENRRFGIPKLQASIREINGLKPTPAFLWSQGDICLQGRMGKEYVDSLRLAKIPVRNGPGNHEMMLEHENPCDDYEALFGPAYHSFDWAGVHCIVLNGNKVIPGLKGYKAVHGAIEGSELAWLKADLAAQPPGKAIVVGIHIPIVTTYPRRRRENPPNAPYWEVTNTDMLTDLFARHHVSLVLQGHMHENERITVKGVEYVESAAISGLWFKGGEGMERGADGAPRGYRIISVDGTKVTHRYYSSCESHVDRPGEFCGLERPVAAASEAAFVFNDYDAPNESTAEMRLDEGRWRPMQPFAAMQETLGLAMTHHFRLVVAPGTLTSGQHAAEARVRWPDGTVVQHRQTFSVVAGEASAKTNR